MNRAEGRLCIARIFGMPPRFELKRLTAATGSRLKGLPATSEIVERQPEKLRQIRLPELPGVPGETSEATVEPTKAVESKVDDLRAVTPSQTIGVVLRLFRDY